MQYSYKTRGTCSREILIDTDGKKIQDVKFIGGCSGNTQAISSLVKGMDIDDVITKCRNIDCAGRGTSCPDQLAQALEGIKNR